MITVILTAAVTVIVCGFMFLGGFLTAVMLGFVKNIKPRARVDPDAERETAAAKRKAEQLRREMNSINAYDGFSGDKNN